MRILFVFLFFGTFMSCFYLECKALKYHGFVQDQRGENSESTFIDSLHRHRSRRNVDGNTTYCPTINCTEKINHKYYVSHTFKDGQTYWREIRGNPKTVEHKELSDHFLRSKTLPLSFRFPYYGHYLDSVLLTTGGFLYMDVHNTKLITDVQYLAPLMAYFNTKLHVKSKVLTLDDGNQLTVQWFQIYLHNKTDVGPFDFQCTLHKNGTIWFAYKQIPIPVENIPEESYHPVRVGISDAFVIRYKDPRRPVIYRYFFIYSQVNITKKSVVNGSAVVFYPQPSCVGVDSCQECLKRNQTTEFDCRWCPAIKKCSDGADRHRAEWENARCAFTAVEKLSDERCVAEGVKQGCVGADSCQECLKRNQTTKFDCRWCPAIKKCSDGADRHRAEWENASCAFTAVEKLSDERCVAEGVKQGCVGADSCQECLTRNQTTEFDCRWCPAIKKCSDGADRHRAEWENASCAFTAVEKLSDERCVAEGVKQRQGMSKSGIGAGAVVGICIVLALIICVTAWCVYAYRNPTSKSGLFLIDATHRPRELFKRSSNEV